MNTKVQKLVEEARPLVEAADRGDFEQAAWTAIADKLIAIQKADTTLSNGAIGKLFGKSATWVRDIVKWRTTSQGPTPWAEDSKVRPRDDRGARKVLTQKPKTVAPEIAKALEDPEVAQEVAKQASLKAVDTMRDAAADEGFDRAMTRQEEKTGTKRPTVKKLLHGKTPQDVSKDLIKNTMDRWLDRLILEGESTWAQYQSSGFRLIEPGDADEYRAKLVALGQHIAGLLDGLDEWEKSEAAQATSSEGR